MLTPGAFAITTLVLGQSPNKARDVLMACIENGKRKNVVAILTQRDPSAEGAVQKIKLQCSVDGKCRHTILEPLRLQGVESVDDGETLTVYIPSDGVVMQRESPSKDRQELLARLDLASRNYTFRFDAKAVVAGRTAVCVVAAPTHGELETRRYFIDEENGFPLRLETVRKSTVKVVFDTKAVHYPTRMRESTFRLQTVQSDAKRFEYSKPKDVKNRDEAMTSVGFSPFVPKTLPMGFLVQDMQVKQGKSHNTLMMQVTDGLARATIFQWKTDGAKMKSMEDNSVIERNGIRVMIVSDLDEDIRMKLLRAFLQMMLSEDRPLAGIVGSLRVDPKSQRELWGFQVGLVQLRA